MIAVVLFGLLTIGLVTVIFVMTISIMVGLILAPIIGKKLQKGLISIGKKDKSKDEEK